MALSSALLLPVYGWRPNGRVRQLEEESHTSPQNMMTVGQELGGEHPSTAFRFGSSSLVHQRSRQVYPLAEESNEVCCNFVDSCPSPSVSPASLVRAEVSHASRALAREALSPSPSVTSIDCQRARGKTDHRPEQMPVTSPGNSAGEYEEAVVACSLSAESPFTTAQDLHSGSSTPEPFSCVCSRSSLSRASPQPLSPRITPSGTLLAIFKELICEFNAQESRIKAEIQQLCNLVADVRAKTQRESERLQEVERLMEKLRDIREKEVVEVASLEKQAHTISRSLAAVKNLILAARRPIDWAAVNPELHAVKGRT